MGEDLENRFMHHPPKDDVMIKLYATNRAYLLNVARHFSEACPQSRELSLAITKLEEAMFWANAAIARNHEGE